MALSFYDDDEMHEATKSVKSKAEQSRTRQSEAWRQEFLRARQAIIALELKIPNYAFNMIQTSVPFGKLFLLFVVFWPLLVSLIQLILLLVLHFRILCRRWSFPLLLAI